MEGSEISFLKDFWVVIQSEDWSRGLDPCSYCYLCLSPLPVLGVAFRSTIRDWVSVFQPSVRCLRLESLKPNTVHCSSSLPLSPHQTFTLLPPFPWTSCFALDTLHSCCHSALSQLQFIPSSWPFRVMHSPGTRGWAVTAAHVFHRAPLHACAGVFWVPQSLNLIPQWVYANHRFPRVKICVGLIGILII